MNKAAVLRVERGERVLSLDEALALAWALNVAPAHLVSPRDGSYVHVVDDTGLSGAAIRNWLLFGDPFPLRTEGQRVKARVSLVYAIENLAQAFVDANRGGDEAGAKAAALALRDRMDSHQGEMEEKEGQ
jgi:hypothetical protein